ncbi:MAG: response regulator transcription factor [Sulfurimonadaceae bacterium]|jgi:DNA-binding response OmpR family regulator|nr:response regulator transcription factor [Sulfurimonadaceae bacterium]
MKILYLEDDLTLSQSITEFLEDSGFEVICAYDGKEALELIYKNIFDIFLLDVSVPYIDGFTLLEELREVSILTPAIFITSRNTLSDLSSGYNSGADDYIKKPFELKELLLRINALLKREYNSQTKTISIKNDVEFDMLSGTLIVGDEKIALHQKEILLLKLFLKNKNQILSFDDIYQNVWQSNQMHSYLSLRTYIKTLRKYLGKEQILSIRNVGYKLV